MSAPELVFPWPDKALHPNQRVHWSVKARAAREARRDGYWSALQAHLRSPYLPAGPIHIWIDGYPSDRRKRDADGLLSAMKPCLDGIADALGVNDHRFIPHPRVMDEVRKGGEVRVRITSELDVKLT